MNYAPTAPDESVHRKYNIYAFVGYTMQFLTKCLVKTNLVSKLMFYSRFN